MYDSVFKDDVFAVYIESRLQILGKEKLDNIPDYEIRHEKFDPSSELCVHKFHQKADDS